MNGETRHKLIRALHWLHDDPKNPTMLEGVTLLLQERPGCGLQSVVSDRHNCPMSCPLADVLESAGVGGNLFATWYRCPWCIYPSRHAWQVDLPAATIMQKCVEMIAILEALDTGKEQA